MRQRPFFQLTRRLLLFSLLMGKTLPLLCLLTLFPAPATAQEHALRGRASWYGLSAHNKLTASGELFNRAALTAAHRTLPFGAVIRVYNLVNSHRVLVRINDRGPFARKRVLDLSLRAAHVLHMKDAGTAPVVMEIVSLTGSPSIPSHGFFILLARERNPQAAHNASSRLHNATRLPIRALFSADAPHPSFFLCIGPYPTFLAAENVFLSLKDLPIAIIEAPTIGGMLLPRHVPPLPRRRPGSP